ncbi:MAG: hypothetical protein E7275_11085 [Pseudobutyrivibrio sp.]|jgi:hypothetical protein|uniref:hypothetical protein n=1 Tax=Pseudobutyrivibrio sp. TaxID=2014367 RepID=UPI0025F139C6|nr:hypothetical protein [Pseudobutyrivibrio sp.]MBE5904808.1 hypothetical protein [Pseudobutyrivibrio sp.]
MKLSGKTIEFDNGLAFSIDDTFAETLKKVESLEHDYEERVFISFKCHDAVKNIPTNVALCFYDDVDGITEIDMRFESSEYAGKKFNDFNEAVGFNKKLYQEVRAYLLEQNLGNITEDDEKYLGIKTDTLFIGLAAGRSFEQVKLNISLI